MKKDLSILFITPLPLVWEKAVQWESQPDGTTRMNLHFIFPGLPNGPLAISAYIQKFFPEIKIRIFDTSSYLISLAKESYAEPFDYDEFLRRCIAFIKKSISAEFEFPDMTAFSLLFNGTYAGLPKYAKAISEAFKGTMIIAGGHLATGIPKKMLSEIRDIDAISYGEGEIPFYGLCKAYFENNLKEYIEKAPSWITYDKIQNGFKPSHEYVENLDDIPRWNLDLLVFLDDYLKLNHYVARGIALEGKEVMLFPTRGCPNHCIFCASQNVHGHKVRRSSAEKVKADMLYYNEKYGATHFVFFNDSVLYYKQLALDLLRFIGDHGWEALIPTPEFFFIDDEVAEAFAYANVQAVTISLETGSQKTFSDIIHKPSTMKRAELTAKYLNKHGVIPIVTLLIGFPGETVNSIMQGIDYLKNLDVDIYRVWIVTPLPGSGLWDLCIEKGYSNGDLMPHYQDPAIETPMLSKTKVKYLFYSCQKWLNYDNNRYFRAGKWKEAYDFYQNPVTQVFFETFLTDYYMALCAKNMGNEDLFQKHRAKYYENRKKETEGDPIYQAWASRELKDI